MKHFNVNDSASEKTLENLLKMTAKLSEKVDGMETHLNRLNEISRNISEIHQLHFPKDNLQTENDLTKRFLAEIIMGKPRRKRK